MEDNFRNVLIILSAIVITAIFIHGLWTLRKQKNPYKLKTSKDKAEPITRDFDRKGFDQDGVSKPKVVGANPILDDVAVKSHTLEDNDEFHSDVPMPNDVPHADFEDKPLDQSLNFGALLNDTEEVPAHLKQQALSDVDRYADRQNYQDNGYAETLSLIHI